MVKIQAKNKGRDHQLRYYQKTFCNLKKSYLYISFIKKILRTILFWIVRKYTSNVILISFNSNLNLIHLNRFRITLGTISDPLPAGAPISLSENRPLFALNNSLRIAFSATFCVTRQFQKSVLVISDFGSTVDYFGT